MRALASLACLAKLSRFIRSGTTFKGKGKKEKREKEGWVARGTETHKIRDDHDRHGELI